MLPPLSEPTTTRIFTLGMVPSVALRTFRYESDLIRRGWVLRKSLTSRTTSPIIPSEKPDDWMVRCTYRLIRSLIGKGHTAILDDEIRHLGIVERGSNNLADQPFKKALLIMFGSTQSEPTRLTRNRRYELGNAMAYAEAHRVPSKYVNGFIKTVGLKKCASKLAEEFKEPGFD